MPVQRRRLQRMRARPREQGGKHAGGARGMRYERPRVARRIPVAQPAVRAVPVQHRGAAQQPVRRWLDCVCGVLRLSKVFVDRQPGNVTTDGAVRAKWQRGHAERTRCLHAQVNVMPRNVEWRQLQRRGGAVLCLVQRRAFKEPVALPQAAIQQSSHLLQTGERDTLVHIVDGHALRDLLPATQRVLPMRALQRGLGGLGAEVGLVTARRQPHARRGALRGEAGFWHARVKLVELSCTGVRRVWALLC
eukprot:901967-Rhodomonas_salina.1